jgi:hypothetical protein
MKRGGLGDRRLVSIMGILLLGINDEVTDYIGFIHVCLEN